MKSPAELADRLSRQWSGADNREKRLLSSDAWPITLSIGKPTAEEFASQTKRVRDHLESWRQISIGEVTWESMRFRAGSEPIDIPTGWRINTPHEWVAACGDRTISQQFSTLIETFARVDSRFHRPLTRQLQLIDGKASDELEQAARVALALTPGCAEGRPLRAIQVAGIDSKFIERNRKLIIEFLDALFGEEVSERGLETFLGACDDSAHWLLVVPLCKGLLPFAQQRVRASEIHTNKMPGSHIVVVENERCVHSLPETADAIAILGAGLNLGWMSAQWLQETRLAYWGDIDTWGLQMLSRARACVPSLTPLLMSQSVFDAFASTCAVTEEVPADQQAPANLTHAEKELYQNLRLSTKGRVEQEFLSRELVHDAIREWRTL